MYQLQNTTEDNEASKSKSNKQTERSKQQGELAWFNLQL
jgi:hypothetical protein